MPGRARDSVRSARNKVTGKVRGGGDDLRRGARRTADMAQENPAGLAVGAAAVGFLAGLMVPTTRTERERLGPIGADVKEKARETGEEAVARGKEVMNQATDAAKQAVEETKETSQQTATEQTSSPQDHPAV
ncbi:MAG: hypothetical protein GEU78_19670 [Actinobacteria bacterium]|nr:hypothetical protein [Actinomycetota bacterium]